MILTDHKIGLSLIRVGNSRAESNRQAVVV